jgi:hypothetical protein
MIPLNIIKREVISEFGLEFDVNSKELPLPYIRACYYVLCKELNPVVTYNAIGNSLNFTKNHASVMHGINKTFPTVLKYEPKILEMYKNIYNRLKYRKFKKNISNIEVSYVNLKNGIIR